METRSRRLTDARQVRVGQREGMTSTTHHPVSRQRSRSLSRRLVVTACLLITGGVSIGWLTYLHRSPHPVRHIPGTNAWWQEAVVAATALVIGGLVWRRRRRRCVAGSLLLAPLSRLADER